METEYLLEIPENWVYSSLKILAKDIYRYPTFYGMEHLEQGVPVIRGEHINDDGTISHDWSNYWFITHDLSQQFPRTILETNDLVMSVRGTVGKIGLVDKELENAQISPNCIKISLYNNYSSSKFFIFYLKSFSGQISINSVTSSTTINTIKASLLSETLIPLPPLNEQRRIVAKIEALKARSQQVKQALEAIPPLLEQFRQSVLAAAFRGDLTADWREKNPDVEPASVLLERIRAERRRRWEEAELEKMKASGKKATDDKWKSKYKEPELVNSLEFSELPNEWCWIPVEILSTKVVDGVHKKPNYVETGIPFVTVKNLTAGLGISFDELNYISPKDHQEFFKRANPECGDILITKDGTLGVVRVVRTERVFSIFVSVALVKPVDYKMSDYLELAFSCPQMREQMLGTGTGLMHIHLKDLRRYAVPVAPIEEQKEIVYRIQSLFKVADKIEQQYREVKAHLELLNQSILAKAFRGELVPQDPNDEPASVLLERIRAERAKQEAAAKTAKKSPAKTTGQRRKKTQQQDAESVQLGLPGLE